MTPKQRMMTAMNKGQPDRVPAAPDMSNMIPCRLTGKPFWDIYLYQNPPRWLAYIKTVKYFGTDGWLDSVPLEFPDEVETRQRQPQWREAIVHRTEDRIYTRHHLDDGANHVWSSFCNVYYRADSPTHGVPLAKVGLPEAPPNSWEEVIPKNSYSGLEAFQTARREMGDLGVVGVPIGLPGLGLAPECVYEYYDHPERVIERCQRQHDATVQRIRRLVTLKPDFVLIGISGFMISNPEPIFRQLALPTLQAITAICKDVGVISQIHCCGPERDLVRIAAEESDLNSINPLEIPPMGDCDLAQIKREYGSRLSLMGNLHTTDVMLRGTPKTVKEASRKAIQDAADGGGFILSTGDQCGRDTPDENILAMIEAVVEFGNY